MNIFSRKLYDLQLLQDLDEDVVITLTAKNPRAPRNVVRFDHTNGEYVAVKLGETMIDHLVRENGRCFPPNYGIF